MLATLCSAFATADDLARAERGTAGWCAPEVLRVHGERLGSEAMLDRALSLARSQGARAWELRTATTLASLWHGAGRQGQARNLLVDALAGFSEGLDCADVRCARGLLAKVQALN